MSFLYCETHYRRALRNDGDPGTEAIRVRSYGDERCESPVCDRLAAENGLCSGHAQRVRSDMADPLATPVATPKPRPEHCTVRRCRLPVKYNGMCGAHAERSRRGDVRADVPVRQGRAGWINPDGYRIIYDPATGRPRREHRVVMEQLLGRSLLRSETVHHLNGVRHDNVTDGPLRVVDGKLRSGNLELWIKSHPAGQRITDKVAWARELLALYGDLVPLPAT